MPNPADAHFSHGEVEPRVLLVQKKKRLKVFKDTDVYEATAAKLARAHLRHRCCLSCNNEGFSPARWTLGDGMHLPENCADLQDAPAAVGRSNFWHPLEMQETCEVALHKAPNSSTLRQALLCRLRPHCWRSRGKTKRFSTVAWTRSCQW